MKIAFLKYPAYQKSRANNFEKKASVGAYVVIDMLKRNGYDCDIVKLHECNKYDLILVSFCSVWDIVAFCRHVYRSKIWIYRKFNVIAGGFGMQSHKNLNGYIDYAYYGRLESIKTIIKMKGEYLYSVDYQGEVNINKGSHLYKHIIDINGYKWKEKTIGCNRKCDFCYYSKSRNFITSQENNYFNFYSKNNSLEIDFWSYKLYNNQSNLTIGLDGWSERLRYGMNKRISNKLIRDALIYISNKSTCKAIRIKLYNIEGYDNESDNDMFEFINNMWKINSYLKTKLFIIIHSTPLFPSPFTKVKNAKIKLNLNLHKRKSFCKYIKTNKLIIEDDNYNQSDAVNLEGIIAINGNEKEFKTIIEDSNYKRLNVIEKINYLKQILCSNN